jgi:ATP-dependent RNA helicase DeaD
MGRMKEGRQRLLVATDIAARGIDISFLPCVVNFEVPDDPELYIHRTGRTGRVDRPGRAVTLIGARDLGAIRRIEWRFGLAIAERVPPDREETLRMLSDRRVREMKERLDSSPVIPDEFVSMARDILADKDAAILVAHLVDRYFSGPPPERAAAPPSQEQRRPWRGRPRR